MPGIIAIILASSSPSLSSSLRVAATKPDTFTYARTTRINAPAGKDRPADQRFPEMARGRPTKHRDPAAEAHLQRQGERGRLGLRLGRQQECRLRAAWKILDIDAEQDRIKLDFFTPFKASNIAEFTFTPRAVRPT